MYYIEVVEGETINETRWKLKKKSLCQPDTLQL